MKEVSSNNFDKLEKLLRSKQFSELLSDDRQWVLQFLSEDEYGEMAAFYNILAGNAAQLGDIEPSTSSKRKLNAAFEKSCSRKKHKFFSLRVPAYQSIAACVIFFMLGLGTQFFIRPEAIGVKNPETVVQNMMTQEEPGESTEISHEKNFETKTQDSDKKQIQSKSLKNLPTAITHDDLMQENHETTNLKALAEHNIQRVQKESSGRSLGSDSVIQILLSTIY